MDKEKKKKITYLALMGACAFSMGAVSGYMLGSCASAHSTIYEAVKQTQTPKSVYNVNTDLWTIEVYNNTYDDVVLDFWNVSITSGEGMSVDSPTTSYTIPCDGVRYVCSFDCSGYSSRSLYFRIHTDGDRTIRVASFNSLGEYLTVVEENDTTDFRPWAFSPTGGSASIVEDMQDIQTILLCPWELKQGDTLHVNHSYFSKTNGYQFSGYDYPYDPNSYTSPLYIHIDAPLNNAGYSFKFLALDIVQGGDELLGTDATYDTFNILGYDRYGGTCYFVASNYEPEGDWGYQSGSYWGYTNSGIKDATYEDVLVDTLGFNNTFSNDFLVTSDWKPDDSSQIIPYFHDVSMNYFTSVETTTYNWADGVILVDGNASSNGWLGNVISLFRQALGAFLPIFSLTIFPGISLGMLVLIPIVAGLFVLIMKVVKQ